MEPMDHLVLAITLPYKRASYLSVFVVVFLLGFTSKEAHAQKRNKTAVADTISAEVQEKISTYFFEGLRQKNVDNEDAAIRSFLKVVELSPKNDAAFFELGLLYTQKKKYIDAVSAFAKATELKPTNEWYLNSYAKALENTGDYKSALHLYEKLTKQSPEKIEIFFDLASVKIYLQDYKGAINTYNDIEKRIGVNEDLINQKQKIWLKLGKVDKAAEEARRLIKKDPTEIRYKMNLAEIYLANKKMDKAIVVLQEISDIDPNNSFVQLALADYYREKKEDDKSFEYLKKAFVNPNLNIDQKVRILSPYFSVLDDVKMKGKALMLSELMVTAHPTDPKATAIYGDFLYQDKQLEKAKVAYEKTIALDKKVFAVWQNLMFIEVDLSDYKALLKTSDEAIELFPAQQLVHYLNAIAKAQNKDFEGAVVAYKNALMLGLPNKEIESQIYAGLGDAYHSLKKHKESDEAYDKALDIKPNDPYVLNNYAYYLSLRNERLEKSLEMSARSNELLKNNSSFLDTYAWILFQLKRYSEAQVWIEKALTEGGANSATIVEHSGDILFHLNRADEALKQWQKAAELMAPSEILKKKIQDKKYYE
jgi:tetratricopeptide (TPR) repeat protein